MLPILLCLILMILIRILLRNANPKRIRDDEFLDDDSADYEDRKNRTKKIGNLNLEKSRNLNPSNPLRKGPVTQVEEVLSTDL